MISSQPKSRGKTKQQKRGSEGDAGSLHVPRPLGGQGRPPRPTSPARSRPLPRCRRRPGPLAEHGPPPPSLPPGVGAAPWVGARGRGGLGAGPCSPAARPEPPGPRTESGTARSLLPEAQPPRGAPSPASAPRQRDPGRRRRRRRGRSLAPFSRTCGWAGSSERLRPGAGSSPPRIPSPASGSRLPGKVGRASGPGERGRPERARGGGARLPIVPGQPGPPRKAFRRGLWGSGLRSQAREKIL